MDRLPDTTELTNMIAGLDAWYESPSRENVDANIPDPLDQYGRADVVPTSPLKRGDDVYLNNWGFAGRVVGPGEGRRRFMWAAVLDPDGPTSSEEDIANVGDRAPIDPEETPMPVWEEPEEDP